MTEQSFNPQAGTEMSQPCGTITRSYRSKDCLLSVSEMAERLAVPKSWIYERTRQGQSAIPFIKLGMYVRFDPEAVINFFKSNGKRIS
jgi:excisionase family DNA binding protein